MAHPGIVVVFLSSPDSPRPCTHAAVFCTPAPAVSSAPKPPVVLMAAQAEHPGYAVARAELLSNGAPPFLACELCRCVPMCARACVPVRTLMCKHLRVCVCVCVLAHPKVGCSQYKLPRVCCRSQLWMSFNTLVWEVHGPSV